MSIRRSPSRAVQRSVSSPNSSSCTGREEPPEEIDITDEWVKNKECKLTLEFDNGHRRKERRVPISGEQVETVHHWKSFTSLNQHLVFGEFIDKCILCGNSKDKNKPRSHTFPKGLLDTFGDIHAAYGNRYIYNMSGKEVDKPIAPKKMSFPTLCEICEVKASKEEGFLKDVYKQVMSNDLSITEDEFHKLKHILAVCLFRGALTKINFVEEVILQSDSKSACSGFFATLLELAKYCSETDLEMYKKSPIASKLQLFLLPNSPFIPDNPLLTYVLDYQLRNPMYTSIAFSEGKPFLYTKFDCFHCVLPYAGNCSFDCIEASKSIPKSLLNYNLIHSFPLLITATASQYGKNILASLQPLGMVKKKMKGRKDLGSAQENSPLRDHNRDVERSLQAAKEKLKVVEEDKKILEERVKKLEEEKQSLLETIQDLQARVPDEEEKVPIVAPDEEYEEATAELVRGNFSTDPHSVQVTTKSDKQSGKAVFT